MPDSCITFVRFSAGVRPVDEDATLEMAGPGSVNRTFFFGLVGVFVDVVAASDEVLGSCWSEAASPSSKPLVRRRFRRTASGRSSGTSTSADWVLSLVIAALLWYAIVALVRCDRK